MNILHIINGEHYSGAERVQDILSLKLPKYGYKVLLACIKPDKFITRCECDKEKVFNFPMRNKYDILQAYNISKFIRSKEIKLIHTHTARSALIGYAVSRLTNLPLVHHQHSPTSRDTDNYIKNSINMHLESFTSHKANKLIAVSNSIKYYLIKKGMPAEKIEVILNGVPSPNFMPLKERPNECWCIGVVALFRPRKGLEYLLEAIGKLKARNVQVKLHAVGEFETKDYEKEIKILSKKLNIQDDITWVGFSNNINDEFKKIDIFTLPSLYGEGLPMVILEAMANGVPVISSNIEGVPEAITSEEYGYLVEPGNSDEIANSIENLISNNGKWEQIRMRSYTRQNKYLSDDAMASELAKIYKELLH
ncbi:MAG: glycosyltransferase [Candidatus Thiodiazotropha sp. 6PLUC2]